MSDINIRENFKHLNNAEMFDNAEGDKVLYSGFEGKASNCTECGQCEDKYLPKTSIREMLKEVVKLFGKMISNFFGFTVIFPEPHVLHDEIPRTTTTIPFFMNKSRIKTDENRWLQPIFIRVHLWFFYGKRIVHNLESMH